MHHNNNYNHVKKELDKRVRNDAPKGYELSQVSEQVRNVAKWVRNVAKIRYEVSQFRVRNVAKTRYEVSWGPGTKCRTGGYEVSHQGTKCRRYEVSKVRSVEGTKCHVSTLTQFQCIFILVRVKSVVYLGLRYDNIDLHNHDCFQMLVLSCGLIKQNKKNPQPVTVETCRSLPTYTGIEI